MPDLPQDVVDEMDGKTVASSADAPSRDDGKDIEVSGEYDPAPDDNDGDEQGPEILNKDQQAVMHRISEAIAHLVYGKDTNQAIIKMALLGPEGVVKAVGAILEKVVMTAKPGIPRELIPMAAFAALVMIQDFLSQMGEKTMPMQEIVPMLVDELAVQFKATPAEMTVLRRLKSKAARGAMRARGVDPRDQAGAIGRNSPAVGGPHNAQEEAIEPPGHDEAAEQEQE